MAASGGATGGGGADEGPSAGCEFTLAAAAYVKMVLHALKYPQLAVNGALVAERRRGNVWRIVDSVPMLHQVGGLAAPLEAALCQIDAACQAASSSTCQLVGLYHANERFDDTALDHFVSRVGEKVHSVFPDAVMLRVSCLPVNEGTNRVRLENEERTMEAVSSCVQTKMYRYLVDFDNHLDNPALDYWNRQLTSKIVSLMHD